MDKPVTGDDEAKTCWLCRRSLGRKVEWHHPVPKSRGGRLTVPVHPICHRTIHANFTNAQLSRMGGEREALLRNEALARFLDWIASKHPDFHAPTRKPGR
ncbi:MAG: HNH endonuclease [Sphingomonadaceae bacterium]